MKWLHIFTLINIAIIYKGWIGALIIRVVGSPGNKEDKSIVDGVFHGLFISALILLQYIHKLGFIKTPYRILPHKDHSYLIGFTLGATFHLTSFIAFVQQNL